MKQFFAFVAVIIVQIVWLAVLFAIWITVSTINAVRYITKHPDNLENDGKIQS